MNELRVYVEHLFEGKVLTGDNIELKEEIYGNLVARYEDYVAGGMPEAEALEKTKASITNIDDVLTGNADEVVDGGASGSASGVSEGGGENAQTVKTTANTVEASAGQAKPTQAASTSTTSAETPIAQTNPTQPGATTVAPAQDEASGSAGNQSSAEDASSPLTTTASSAVGSSGSGSAPVSTGTASAENSGASPVAGAASTTEMPTTAQGASTSEVGSAAPQTAGAAASVVSAAPADSSGSSDSSNKAAAVKSFASKYKKSLIAVASVAVVLLVAVGAFAAMDEFFDFDDDDRRSSNVNASSQVGSTSGSTNSGNSGSSSNTSTDTSTSSNTTASGVSADGVSTTRNGYAIYLDANGNLRYEDDLADDLIYAIVDGTYSDVSGYAGTSLSDSANVETFVRSLTMGEWVSTVDTTTGVGVLSYTYDAVPAMYDGDSIEAALAYNATIVFCAISDVDTIEVMVSESDEPYDYDYYVFERSSAETLYGFALTNDLVSETGWTQIKNDSLYTSQFIDRMIDWAERS